VNAMNDTKIAADRAADQPDKASTRRKSGNPKARRFNWRKWLWMAGTAAAVVALGTWMLWPTSVKVEVAVARGKDRYDKRHAIKERDIKRDLSRSLSDAGR